MCERCESAHLVTRWTCTGTTHVGSLNGWSLGLGTRVSSLLEDLRMDVSLLHDL